jgi:hypothetical protein
VELVPELVPDRPRAKRALPSIEGGTKFHPTTRKQLETADLAGTLFLPEARPRETLRPRDRPLSPHPGQAVPASEAVAGASTRPASQPPRLETRPNRPAPLRRAYGAREPRPSSCQLREVDELRTKHGPQDHPEQRPDTVEQAQPNKTNTL